MSLETSCDYYAGKQRQVKYTDLLMMLKSDSIFYGLDRNTEHSTF